MLIVEMIGAEIDHQCAFLLNPQPMKGNQQKRRIAILDQHFIAWWNLENLFDVEGPPPDRDEGLALTGTIEEIE